MTFTAKTYWRKYYPRESYVTTLRRIKGGNIPSNHKVTRQGRIIIIDVVEEERIKKGLPFNVVVKGRQ